jgi:hypothetical protein
MLGRHMYFTPTTSIFMIISILMVLIGNLITTYKIFKKSLDHAAKCGCCGDKKEEGGSVIDGVKTIAHAVKG